MSAICELSYGDDHLLVDLSTVVSIQLTQCQRVFHEEDQSTAESWGVAIDYTAKRTLFLYVLSWEDAFTLFEKLKAAWLKYRQQDVAS